MYQRVDGILWEVRIHIIENCCNIVKKLSAGLEIGVKFKDHIPQKRTQFSYEFSGEPLNADKFKIKIFIVIIDTVIKCINMCFELCKNYKSTQFLIQPPWLTGDVRGNIKMHCIYLHLKLNSN